MKLRLRRPLAMLLTVVMLLGLLPTAAFAAPSESAVSLSRTGNLRDYQQNQAEGKDNDYYDYVWYGGLKWRVLDTEAVADEKTNSEGVLLLSENVLNYNQLWHAYRFNTDRDGGGTVTGDTTKGYNVSDIRAYLTGEGTYTCFQTGRSINEQEVYFSLANWYYYRSELSNDEIAAGPQPDRTYYVREGDPEYALETRQLTETNFVYGQYFTEEDGVYTQVPSTDYDPDETYYYDASVYVPWSGEKFDPDTDYFTFQRNSGLNINSSASAPILGTIYYVGYYTTGTNQPTGTTVTSTVVSGQDAANVNLARDYGFSDIEQKTAIPATKTEPDESGKYYVGTSQFYGGSLLEDTYFLLSASEAFRTEYGMNIASNRMGKLLNGTTSALWWLRSATAASSVAFVNTSGEISNTSANNPSFGTRPAFYLDPTAVLFTSDVEGGKNAAVGTFSNIASDSTQEWKLTLLDSGMSVETGTVNNTGNNSYSLEYSNASTYGDDVYLSAIVTDGAGKQIYSYAKLAEVTSSSGTVTFTLPEGYTMDNCRVQVFLEKCGEKAGTDYASEPVTINEWTHDDTQHWHTGSEVKTDHTFTEWTTDRDNCAQASTETRYCTICGYTETQNVVAGKHTLEHHARVPAQCSDGIVGREEYWFCTVCEGIFKDEDCTLQVEYLDDLNIPPVHVYADNIEYKPADGESAKYYHNKLWVCENCGETVRSELHVHDRDVQCGKIGVCDTCGYKFDPREHFFGIGMGSATLIGYEKMPTCDNPGTGIYKCYFCEETTTAEVAALGHLWSLGTQIRNPDYDTEGLIWFYCTRCLETKVDTIPILEREDPTITFSGPTSFTYNGQYITSGPAGTAGVDITYSYSGSEITSPVWTATWYTVDGNGEESPLPDDWRGPAEPGNYILRVSVPQTGKYNAAEASCDITIQKGKQIKPTFSLSASSVTENGAVSIINLNYGEAYENPKVTYTSSNSEVASIDGNGTITLHAPGSVAFTVTYEETEHYNSATSDTVTLNVTEAQIGKQDPPVLSVEEPTAVGGNGKLNGLTAEMEYRVSGETEWKDVTQTEISSLAPGTYEVRYKANEEQSLAASDYVTHTIHHRFAVTKNVIGDGIENVKDKVTFNEDFPDSILEGHGFSFSVTVDEGYTAIVSINGVEQTDSLVYSVPAATVTMNITVQVSVSAVIHTVSFSTGSGSYCKPIQVAHGEPYGALPTPVYSGYRFDGWYQNADCTGELVTVEMAVLNDHTLYAKWVPLKTLVPAVTPVTVDYDGQPHSVTPTATVYGSAPVETVTEGFTVEYKLQGESDETYTTDAPSDPGTYTVRVTRPADDEYQQFSIAGEFLIIKKGNLPEGSHTITILSAAHGTISTVPSGAAAEGTEVTLTITPAQGYRLKEGSLTVTGPESQVVTVSGNQFTMPAHNVTVSAVFEAIEYSITYELDGGTNAAGNPTNYTVEQGIMLAAPTKDGYIFQGWTWRNQTTPQQSVNISAGSITGNLTFTAHWQEDTPIPPTEYTVTVEGSYADTTGEGKYAAGDTVTIDAGSPDELTFNGWTVTPESVKLTNADSATTTFTMPAGNVTVTANWASNEKIQVIPADIIIYMGGKPYEGAVDGSGAIISNQNAGLPEPGFRVTLPDALKDEDITSLTFKEKDGERTWTFQPYDGQTDTDVYKLVPANGQTATRVQFTDPDTGNVVPSDEFIVGLEVNKSFGMELYKGSGETAVGDIIVEVDGVEYAVDSSTTGTLTVRGTTEDVSITSVASTAPADGKPGAVADASTTYTINDSDVAVTDGAVSLLFDGIINNEGNDRTGQLEQRAAEALSDENIAPAANHHFVYELKYLDLVDANNGNAWVKASDDVTIYWPLPEGADTNTLKVLHFKDLHRNMTTGQIEEEIARCKVEIITPTVSGNHVTFKIGSGGFSPFALVWEEDTPASSFTIEATVSGSGSISPSGTISVAAGSNQTITFIPDSGYYVSSVVVDGQSVSWTGNSYTFTNVTANHTIIVTFAKSSGGSSTTYYTIDAEAGQGGEISPDGRVRVARGSDKTFTITPDEGYRIADVLVDGRSIGVVSRYTFENVRSNHTIKVFFEKYSSVADPDDTGVSEWLDTSDHRDFLHGYTDGTFGPNRNMTRGEVAQMFYNLLLEQDVPQTTAFTDVPADMWCADAVNTLASLGIVEGIGNGLYAPDRAITRAEFTVIAMRFAELDTSGENIFSDVDTGDWFYEQVVGSIKYGWIQGYADGTFRPDNTITRAEVTTITNRMLGRAADEAFVDRHSDELRQFPDVPESYWAYYNIVEATNAHDFSMENGAENWSGLN